VAPAIAALCRVRGVRTSARSSPSSETTTRRRSLAELGAIAHDDGDLSLAAERFREVADVFERIGDDYRLGVVLANLAEIEVQRRPPTATTSRRYGWSAPALPCSPRWAWRSRPRRSSRSSGPSVRYDRRSGTVTSTSCWRRAVTRRSTR
jgi:hypothetical protein